MVGLIAAGGAFAYMTAGGGSTDTYATASSASVPLVVYSPGTKLSLTLGAAPSPETVTISNLNTTPIRVVSVTAAITGVQQPTVFDNGKPACVPTDFLVVAPDGTGTMPVNKDVAAGPDGMIHVIGFTVSLKNTDANQDNCRGAIVNYSYSVK